MTNRSHIARAAHLLTLLLTLLPVAYTSAQPTPPPNILMIFTDDMGYSDISSFSNTDLPVTTPNIDRIANEGMKFTHFYVAMPICSPSRAAVLSGRFSPESGLTNFLQERVGNNNSDQNDYMNPNISHLPKAFQAAGYATGHVGKWHLGGGRDVDNAPAIRLYGYDEAYSTWESPNPDPGLGVKFTPWNFTNTEAGQVPRHARTEYMVNKTLDFMARHQGTPCFVTLWPDDLHTPFVPTPAMITKHGGTSDGANTRANFYGVLEEYDRQIGRLLDGLDSLGVSTNTIVLFTGDNGPSPDFGTERTNGMIGRKLSLHEGGIRQPFIIRWPGHITPGSTNAQTVLSAIDFLPTLTGLAGVPLSPEAAATMDGEDLSAAMTGTAFARTKPLFWEYGRNSSVPRPGIAQNDHSPPLGIREGDYKLLLEFNNTGHELYNVRTNPNESNNLAAAQPALVQSMAAKALAWRATLPHRDQPYPPFSVVNFQQFGATQFVSAAALQAAAGATSTARIDGVAAGPNGTHDEIYVIHVDAAGIESFLRIDPATLAVTKITDTTGILANLNVNPALSLNLRAGFDYSPPGDRLFFADDNLALPDQALLLSINVGTRRTSVISNSTNLDGISDHTVLPDGTVAVARAADGNRTVGSVAPATGAWIQHLTQANLTAAAPGTTILSPEAIGANNSTGLAYMFAHGDGELFSISNLTGSPGISRIADSAFASADLHDISVDQAGNMYSYDVAASQLIIRAATGAVVTVPLSQLSASLGAAVTPTPWRGLAARMADNTHSDLFIATEGPDLGLIKIRFGNFLAAVNNWSLY